MSALRVGPRVLLVLATLTLLLGAAKADTVYIDDIPGMTPTVKVFDLSNTDVTALRVSIKSSTSSYIHFTLAGTPSLALAGISYANLYSDAIGGTLADRLIVTLKSDDDVIDVQYGMMPGQPPLIVPLGSALTSSIVEKSTYQQVGVMYITNIGDGNYHFFERTQTPPPVPEPASILLLGTGLLGGARWIAKKRNSLR